MIGQTLGHYRILDQLGAGGMGEVYRAEDSTLKRQVALKVLPTDLASSQERLERFQREAETLAALDHPNIVHIYTVEEAEGVRFLTMQLVKGKPLSELIPEGGMALNLIFDLAIPLADALASAHEKGVIHRDLKPANIVVTDEGRVKVLDFGLAKLRREADTPVATEMPTEPLTQEGLILGTMPYMSPEQLQGKEIDDRSDIFSLGVVFYEMVTARRPFAGDNPASLISSILKDTPREVDEIREGLPHHLSRIIQHCLKKEPHLRSQTVRDIRNELTELRDELQISSRLESLGKAAKDRPRWLTGSKIFLAVLFLLVVATTLMTTLGGRSTAALSDTDEILVTNFVNRTGDPIFDGTLDQALAVKLEESPFLLIASESRVRDTLQFMGRDPDEAVTPETGREVCVRQGLKAMITGEIAQMGSDYIVSLSAIECKGGSSLSRELVEATGKEGVLSALGNATTKIREDLGESLASIERFDAPLEGATTSSLEALQAFSRGQKLRARGQGDPVIALFKRAIELDSEFAQAYGALGAVYTNLREWELARKYHTRAFELRDQVSEREGLYIAAHYHTGVTGDVDKQIEVYEQFKQAYPRDWIPLNNLAVLYNDLGWFEKAVEEGQLAVGLNPNHVYPFGNLAEALRSLGHLTEAKKVYAEALEKGFTYHLLYIGRYLLAHQEGDEETMERMAVSLAGNSGEAWMLATQANIAASAGYLDEARDLTKRAVEVSRQFGFTEQSAVFTADAAVYESAFGNLERSQDLALASLEIVRSRDTMPYAAAVLSASGAVRQAQALIDELTVEFPDDTIINRVQVPIAQALIALQQQEPQHAITQLESAIPYERSFLWTIYFRGEAYLMAGEANRAVYEFLKLQDLNRNQPDNPVHTIAQLGLARSLVDLGDYSAAQQEYEQFLEIVAESDEGVPLIEVARAEYQALLEKYGQEAG